MAFFSPLKDPSWCFLSHFLQDKSHLLSQGLAGSTIVFVFHHLTETTACSAHFFSMSISKAAHDILWAPFSWGINRRFHIPLCPKLFALPRVYDSLKKKIHLFFFFFCNGTQIMAILGLDKMKFWVEAKLGDLGDKLRPTYSKEEQVDFPNHKHSWYRLLCTCLCFANHLI